MVRQYPHEIYEVVVATQSELDENGNFTSLGDPEQVFVGQCRAEANSEGKRFAGPDGEAFIYQFVVYMPKPARTILPGATVKISSNGRNIFSGQVKRTHEGLLNFRLWV
jgi:hypothetical protein